jgi:DNA-binding transcriptional LysR family regulator
MTFRSTTSINSEIGLREFEALVTVADLGSFRRAAEELGFTQSALSHQIANLERKLGHELFIRPGGRGAVRMTPAGEAACRRARRVLSESRAILADIEEAGRGERLRLRVGVTQTVAAEIMPPALRDFREVHPGVEVVLSEVDGDDFVVNALASDRLDLGFVHGAVDALRVETATVTQDRWVILTRRGGLIGESDRPALEVLDGMDLVAWSRRWRSQRELEALLAARGISPRIVYRTDDNLALQRLVAVGLGAALVGNLSVLRAVDPSLWWIVPRDVAESHPIVVCWSRTSAQSPSLAALVSSIRAQAPHLPD